MKDIFDTTVATYRDEAGAAAFVAKELPHDAARSASVYSLLDGLDISGWRVLDVGCGFGRDVGEFRRRGAEAYGCDVSPALLDKADERVKPYLKEYDWRSGESLPFGGGFDLIWCCAVLVHVPRAELIVFLRRLWDGLKAGGRLALYTKCGKGEQVVRNLGENLPRVMVFYTVEDITSIFNQLGAEIEMASGDFATTALGDALLVVRVRKTF